MMKIINRFISTILISALFIGSLMAADKDVDIKKGWNQITVPYDHVKVVLLIANPDIEIIWAYQRGKYNLASNVLDYKLMAKESDSIGIIESLSYGESLYVFAKESTTITFVGVENTNPPVRSGHITPEWKQMSRNDFKSTQWNVISKIVEGSPVIVSKIVMVDGRPSIKVYTNDANEAAKISPEFFEDFEVGESESFWIRDISSVDDINRFDFTISGAKPTQGGDIVKFAIDANSINKNRHYLSVMIVAIKDGDTANKQYTLFNDYIEINHGTQEIKAVMPMLGSGDDGRYRIFAIKDLSAQYDQEGIDLYNMQNEDEAEVAEVFEKILLNSEYRDVTLSGNNPDAVYDMKIESREYANSVLYYDPLKELNRLAQNQSRDLVDMSYTDIGRHTEFQLSLDAYGNSGDMIASTKIRAYVTVGGVQEPIIVLGDNGDLQESYQLADMEISQAEESHSKELTLSLMMYGPEALSDNKNTTLYSKILDDMSVDAHKVCLDSSCSLWLFKKEYEVGFAVADTSDHDTSSADIIGKTTITLFSETFSSKVLDSYESKDTAISLANILLKSDTYYDEIDKRRIGLLGTDGDSQTLIDDLETLKVGLENNTDSQELFDPLTTYETELLKMMMYHRDSTGEIDESSVADATLEALWNDYMQYVGEPNVCDRENYFGLTVPYTKELNDPAGGNPVDVLTATDDLCLYNVKYSHILTLDTVQLEWTASKFREFIKVKKSRKEEERLADFWNPLLSFSNATLHMPEFLGLTIPVVNKRIGAGAYFSAKLALDSELNELRTAIYSDVDAALIAEFKLMDLDFEVVISGSDPDASRFDFYLYSINPLLEGERYTLKKIVAFHQPIATKYATSEKADATLAKKLEIEFGAGPIQVRFEFEVGLYSYFMVGVDLDMSEKFMIYAVPGSRVYGTIAGGLEFSLALIKLEVELRADDFTIVRAAVPLVAQLDNFRLDRSGFSTDFKLFSNIELKIAEILLELNVKITAGVSIFKINIVDMTKTLWEYDGIDPLSSVGHVGTGQDTDVTPCQERYYGWELFCIKKTIAIEFAFSGLTTAECSLLDDEYKRRRDVDGDTSYLYSTNEYRKVRGCINDKYEFVNISIDDWDLSDAQMDDINNVSFWKWDSRATISRQLEDDGITLQPTVSEILREALFEEEPEDVLNDAWKELTGIDN